MKLLKLSTSLFIVILLLSGMPRTAMATSGLLYEGARPLGMGRAFSAVADDENAKWWNPAGMVYLPRWQFDLRGFSQVSEETSSVLRTFPYKDIQEIQKKVEDGEDILSIDETQDVLDYLEDMDEVISAQSVATIGLTWPKLGTKKRFALGFSSYLRAEVDNAYIQKSGLTSDIPNWIKLTAYQIIYDVKIDQVYNFSAAYSLFDLTDYENKKRASVGVNLKYLTRYRFTDIDDPYTVQDLLENDVKAPTNITDIPHASTLALDIGTLCSPDDWVTFAIVAQDLGASLSYDNSPTEHIPANIKVGTAVSPLRYYDLAPLVIEGEKPDHDYDVLLALEVDDLAGQVRKDKKDLADKLHAGIEAKYNMFSDFFGIAVRAGDNQGYATYGVGLDLFWFLSVDYAFYGNELDDYQTIEAGFTF